MGMGHALPHAPQWATLVAIATHAPEQETVPAGHRSMHVPAEQASVGPQRTPHPPQLPGSTRVSTQVSPHLENPAWQVKAQTPSSQTADPKGGAWHVRPQTPQLPGSARVFLHSSPQSENPSSQASPQRPATQMAAPLRGASQARPQRPQFQRSEPSATHVAPQTTRPSGQSSLQLPSAHTIEGPHLVPHAPQ